MEREHFDTSIGLFRRAAEIIPQGIYGHLTPVLTGPLRSPYYVARAEGCRYWDVDGHEYLDFMCGYGVMVLGYNHPEVEAAAAEQRKKVDCSNHPAPVMVELAEHINQLIPMADWVVFGKNGADMTNHSLMIARHHTGRKKIVTIKGAYHGTAPWTGAGHAGVIEEDRSNILTMDWGNVAQFRGLVDRYRGEIAGAILTPYHHPTYAEQVLPPHGYWREIREISRREGIVLILDDVRAGFRLHMQGSHEHFGFEPDISCYGKAMGNCHSVSAMVGKEALRVSAAAVFYTGSYWFSAVPMAASLATLQILERDEGIAKMQRMGGLLARGLEEMARAHGQRIVVSGPPSIPFMTFAGSVDFRRAQLFSAVAMRQGVFLHPHHNWFVSAAHEREDIEQALNVADSAFASVKRELGVS